MDLINLKTKIKKKKILFFWEGFPPCALLLTELKYIYGNNLTILATKANVNFPNFEIEYPNLQIEWLSNPNEIWDLRNKYINYDIVIHTGWVHRGWTKYTTWMKKNDVKLYFTVDNIYNASFKQFIGFFYFRFFLKNKYDAVFVPGNATSKFLKFLGMPSDKIYCGYYGAYEAIYYSNKPIFERNNEFFYVGQLINRKGLDTLLNAYKIYRQNGGNWNLRISGSGPLENFCFGEGIIFENFLSPKECASRMKNSKCFILASRIEHWGTVVCEAAASGMLLILSDKVGSSDDLMRNGINGYLFKSSNTFNLSEKMMLITKWNENRLSHGSEISKSISNGYNSKSFLNGFLSMIES
jgi:glycosyltransferase involved in cell wall biosynthesis